MATTSRAAPPLAAYVLHRWDWSETSLVVELFTRAQGRVVVVAKGAKRPTSQLRPVLLPFQPLWALLGKAPADDAAEVHTLRSAEWAGGAPLLPAAVLLSGCYLNELLMKLLARQDPHPALYDAYASTLAALAAASRSGAAAAAAEATAPSRMSSAAAEAAALRAFELRLLRETGLLPDLASVAAGDAVPRHDAHYTLRPETGLVQAAAGEPGEPREGALPGAAWLQLQAALDHGDPAVLRAACAPLAAALRGPVRALLDYHLGDTPLRTRRVGRELQRLADAGAPGSRSPTAAPPHEPARRP